MRNAYRIFNGKLEILNGKDHSEDQGVDGNKMSNWVLGRWGWGVDWITLLWDRDGWQALMNMTINLRVP
jgi:hypothetical protein